MAEAEDEGETARLRGRASEGERVSKKADAW
jgi:hypothetical protein